MTEKNPRILVFALLMVAVNFQACMMAPMETGGGYRPLGAAQASPYILTDDPPSTRYGIAGMYSYAHSAKGQRFALDSWENRGSFRTRLGTIITFSLGIHLSPAGGLYSEIVISDLSDPDDGQLWTYKTTDRGTFTFQHRHGRTYSLVMTGGPMGTVLALVVDGESMVVTLNDLYLWRKMKAQDWRNPKVHLGSEEYIILGCHVETDDDWGGGNAFFKASDLLEDIQRLEPRYGVRLVKDKVRLADRVPIGDSGYEDVWDPARDMYIIHGYGETASPLDDSAKADDVYAAWKSSVVKIESGGGTGTGFIVSAPRRLVLTNDHVADQTDVQVAFANGFLTRGTVIARDPFWDLALVRVDMLPSGGRETLFSASSSSLGQEVVLIGHPAGFDWTLSCARIAAFRTEEGKRWLQLDGAVNPGNSGGPVFDKQGNVVGVIRARGEYDGDRVILNIGIAIPADVAREFVAKSR